jgi:hypothetical protein
MRRREEMNEKKAKFINQSFLGLWKIGTKGEEEEGWIES